MTILWCDFHLLIVQCPVHILSYGMLFLSLKLSHFSDIWLDFSALMFHLEPKGKGGESSLSVFYCLNTLRHKVLICTEHHIVCPFVGIGTPPTPLPQVSVPSPPP